MTPEGQAKRSGAGEGSNGSGGLLRMKELAEASGVPAPTIKHYLREGLLPEPVKTSRNMAYYPPEFVERIRLIKRLQEERYMPLRAIKSVLDQGPDRARALIEIEDRILERALEGERTRTSAAEVRKAYGVPREVLDRLEQLEILSPNSRGYSPSDVKVIEAISRFRAGGYDEEIGFTVYDTLRYKRALEQLVKEEVGVLTERLAGEMEPERVAELIEAGAEPLKDLIAALHTKLLIAELERHPAARLRRDQAAARISARPCSRRDHRLVAELAAGLRDIDGALLGHHPAGEAADRRRSGERQGTPGGLGDRRNRSGERARKASIGRHHPFGGEHLGDELAQDDRVAVGDEVGLPRRAPLGPQHETLDDVADVGDRGQVPTASDPGEASLLDHLPHHGHQGRIALPPDEARADHHRLEAVAVGVPHRLLGPRLGRRVGGLRVGPQRRGLVDVDQRLAGHQRRLGSAVDEAPHPGGL